MRDILFSFERIVPFFLLIVLGWILRAGGKVPAAFYQSANDFVYKVALPLSLFHTIAFAAESAVRWGFLCYIALATFCSFFLIWGVTELCFREKALVGTLVQGSFRGNFALLGVPLATAVAGQRAGQIAAFAVIAVIPLYNLLSVIILNLRGRSGRKPELRGILLSIAKNPLILAILCGLPFFISGVRLPAFVDTTLGMAAQTATPLGLLSIGGLFRFSDATARLRPALYATFLKLVAMPLLFVPLGYLLGFRGEELFVLLVLYAAPCAISSYPMACALGGDGPLASNILILTTLFSAFLYGGGIGLLRILGL